MAVESKQRLLAYNQSFNIHALFAEIDADKNGYLTIEELEKWAMAYFAQDARLDWEAIARLWNSGADGNSPNQRIYFDEFAIGLTGGLPSAIPSRVIDRYGYPAEVRFTANDTEALKKDYVFNSFVAVLAEIDKLASMDGKPLYVDQAEKLWRALDRYGYGPMPVSTIGRWLLDVAGFNAPMAELESLLNTGGMISRDQFIERIAIAPRAEDVEGDPEMAASTKQAKQSLRKPVPGQEAYSPPSKEKTAGSLKKNTAKTAASTQ